MPDTLETLEALEDRTFDRLPEFDERSREYPLRTTVAGLAPRSYTWRHVQLNQGTEGACVGFGCVMEAAARPVPVFGNPLTHSFSTDEIAHLNRVAREHYYAAQRVDQWPGEDYEGSSVIAGLKVGVAAGYWTEYRWALGPGGDAAAQDVILALGYKGPVVMGTNWWSGMDRPDDRGFLRKQGLIRGGHCYLLTRYSKSLDAVWTPNSWGGGGQGWISRADLAALLADAGEAAIVGGRRDPVS